MKQTSKSYLQANKGCIQLFRKLLWIDTADLRCSMGKASSSLGRASDTDMKNIKSVLRYLHGNPGIMTVRPTTLNLEAMQTAPVGSVLTCGDSCWARDAARFSVSGTASWLRGKLGWYPIIQHRAENRRRLRSAVAKLSWLLHFQEPVKAWFYDSSAIGYDSSATTTRGRRRQHNRSQGIDSQDETHRVESVLQETMERTTRSETCASQND